MYGLNEKELKLLKSLNTPKKIQDFLNKIPINFEKEGDTCMSPKMVLEKNKAHCIEGAMLAALALRINGAKPLVVDLTSVPEDFDHVICVFKRNGFWGAISKTNHGVLRFRDPIYRTPRELAISYFHEYFLADTGRKTLRAYSRPFSLKRFGNKWVTSDENLWDIAHALDESTHFPLVPKNYAKHLRPSSNTERAAGSIAELDKKNPRT